MSKTRSEGERLRERISARTSRTDGLPAELRAEAVAYARRRVDAGSTRRVVAQELGVSATTVARWLAMEPTHAKKLLPVRVTSASATRGTSGARTFTVTSGGGLHIDGLSLADVVELLRAHG